METTKKANPGREPNDDKINRNNKYQCTHCNFETNTNAKLKTQNKSNEKISKLDGLADLDSATNDQSEPDNKEQNEGDDEYDESEETQCQLCPLQFDTIDELVVHIKTKHVRFYLSHQLIWRNQGCISQCHIFPYYHSRRVDKCVQIFYNLYA